MFQQQRISGDAEAAQEHGAHSDDGGQQPAHGNGYADGVVHQRKHQILVNLSVYMFGQIQIIQNLAGISLHQRNIRGLFAQMASGVDGYGQIRLYKGRGVIDAVTHHGNDVPFFLHIPNQLGFIPRKFSAVCMLNAQHISDGPCGIFSVPGYQCCMVSLVLQCFDGVGRRFPKTVSKNEHGTHLFSIAHIDR